MKKLGYAGLSSLLCLAFSLPVLGQQPAAGAAAAAPAADEACNAKYRSYYAAQSDMKLFDDYVNDPKCKESIYRNSAFQLMAKALSDAMKWKDMMTIATRYEKEVPAAAKTDGGLYITSQGLTAASQVGDAAKMIEFGEKVLVISPNDLNAILVVATTIPVSNLPTDPAALDKAMNRAMELAKKLLAMTRPEGVDDKVWQLQVLGPAHGVVGVVYLQKTQYPEAAAEFEQAVKINPKDQLSWYRYGISLTKITIAAQALIGPAIDEINNNRTPGPERDAAIAKRDAIQTDYDDKRDKTIDIMLSAVALPDAAITKAAKATLDSLWMPAHDNTLNGLDDAIAKRKAELNSK